jgi:hypothetical protein
VVVVVDIHDSRAIVMDEVRPVAESWQRSLRGEVDSELGAVVMLLPFIPEEHSVKTVRWHQGWERGLAKPRTTTRLTRAGTNIYSVLCVSMVRMDPLSTQKEGFS